MPAGRTQTTRIVHRIPVVQTAILHQRQSLIAGVDVRTEVLAGAAALTIDSGGTGCRRGPLPVRQPRRNHGAVGVGGCAKVLREPALVTDLNNGVGMAVHLHFCAGRSHRGAAAVVRVGCGIILQIGRVRAAIIDTGAIFDVGRSVVVVRSWIRAAFDDWCRAASIIDVGRGVVLDVSMDPCNRE